MNSVLALSSLLSTGLSKLAKRVPQELLNDYLKLLNILYNIPNQYNYDPSLNDLALTIMKGKYYLRDEKGGFLEHHPEDVYRRVAAFIAAIDNSDAKHELAIRFFELMRKGYFIPGGRVLAGAGDLYRLKTLANCFVSIIQDDSIESIYRAAYEAARTYSYGGGIGIDISVLRPAGAVVHNASNTSTGAVSFMQLYSLTTGLIGQEGRRGALMLTIHVKHPDIMNFILAKSFPNYDSKMAADLIRNDLGLDEIAYSKVLKRIIENFQVRYANISIKFTDEFFSALNEQNEYDGKIVAYRVRNYSQDEYEQDYETIHYSYDIPSKDISKYEFVGAYDSISELNSSLNLDVRQQDLEDVWNRDIYGDYIVRKGEETFAIRYAGDFLTIFRNREAGEIRRMYKARDIWNAFVIGNYNFAEPGLIFWSKMTKYSNSNYVGRPIIGTNPCSEVPLEDGGACNLGSINLVRFVKNPFQTNAYIDYALLDEVLRDVVRFMDNVVEWNIILHPLEKQREASRTTRRVGIGVMGIADMFLAMNIAYDSDQALQLLEEVMSFIANRAYFWSAELAKERGNFPALKNIDQIFKSPFIQEAIDKKVQEHIRKNGLRNVALLSIAPTGSISNIVISFEGATRDDGMIQVYTGVSGGIEPIFSLFYTRYSENLKRTFYVFHSTVRYWLDARGIDVNSIDNEKAIDELLPEHFKRTAHKIDWKMRIKVQGVAQKYVDHSISSTINLPEDVDPEKISELYIEAWRNGLKGITIYREGSRFAILNTGNRSENLEKFKNRKYRVITKDGVKEVAGLEVFIGKDNRLYTPYHAQLKGADVFLDNISNFLFKSDNGVARSNTKQKSDWDNNENLAKCPNCGEHALRIENGCHTCLNCGYSKCDM
ncbi:MAG: adenosylcobalamin-dependent ribonucleoside-diphosphate reductase [Candidatus Anstonellales archaeon]